jgi:hypothetical protein
MREEVFSAGEPGKETLVDLAAKVINHRDDGFRATDLDDPLVKALVLFAHGADRTSGCPRRSVFRPAPAAPALGLGTPPSTPQTSPRAWSRIRRSELPKEEVY